MSTVTTLLSASLLAGLGLAGLGLAATPAQDAPSPPDTPVLRVQGTEISRARFEEWLVHTRGELECRDFVDAWLVRREAQRLGLPDQREAARQQTLAEIEERIEKAHQGDRQRWVDELALSNRSPEGRILERTINLETEFLLRAIASVDYEVPAEAVEAAWIRRYGRGGRHLEVRLLFKRLVVPSVPGETRQEQKETGERLRAELLEEIRGLRERALQGESFASLARAHSEDASRGSGGRPRGGFQTLGWPEADVAAIYALEEGGISEPVFARGGWWIVQVEGITVTPLEEVADALREELLAQGPGQETITAVHNRLWEGADPLVLPAMYAGGVARAEAPFSDPSEAVLRVAGQDVSRGALATFLRHTRGEPLALRYGEHWAIQDLARRSGIEVTDAEVTARVEEDIQRMIEEVFQGDAEKWALSVEQAGRTPESLRRESALRARDELVLEATILAERNLDEAAVRQVWEQRFGPGGRQLDVRYLRLDPDLDDVPPETPPEEWERLRQEAIAASIERAEDIVQRVEDGEDFGALARRFSTDEMTRTSGGEPPEGFQLGYFPEAVGQAVAALTPGQATWAQVSDAVLVIELRGVEETPFEGVRDALRAELSNRRPTMVEVANARNLVARDLQVEVLPAMFR